MRIIKRTTWAPILIGLGAFWIIGQILGTQNFCYFKVTTGFPCPACGMTRAFLAVFRGDFSQAFIWHPLWPLVLLYPMLHFGVSIFLGKTEVQETWLPIGIFLIFLTIYAYRMYLLFPSVAPLDYNTHSLGYWLIDLFKKY